MIYYETQLGTLYNGNCLEIMKSLPNNSVDMVLCDLPYAVTANKWDVIIPFDKLWEEYNRVVKDNCAIVLTATQPFSTMLVNSNLKGFKHEWIWEKEKGVGFQIAKYRPMQKHEHIIVFEKNGKTVNYFPIMEKMEKRVDNRKTLKKYSATSPISKEKLQKRVYTHKYPTSILKFNREQKVLHPTQKPTELFEYLVKTYTKKGDVVLDNTSGSGTTAIACEQTNRKWICIEKEKEYCDVTIKRLQSIQHKLF